MARRIPYGIVPCLLAASASLAWATSNLNLSKSNINRNFPKAQVITGSTTLTGPNQSQTVYTTPANADFVLTQFCSAKVAGGVRLSVDGFGGIAETMNTTLCYGFDPGMSLPKSSTIYCSTTAAAQAGNHFCTISGILRPDPIP